MPAGLGLVETVDLGVDESPFTGGSVPVQKNASRVLSVNTPPADRASMAFMGTRVVEGKGVGAVATAGMDTFIGRTAEEVSSTPGGVDEAWRLAG